MANLAILEKQVAKDWKPSFWLCYFDANMANK